MKLAELIRGASPAPVATLTVATPATLAGDLVPSVATVAGVTVAKPGRDAVDVAAFRARWRMAAMAAGVIPDLIDRVPAAELEHFRRDFAAHPDPYRAMQASARLLQETADMEAGRVPDGWTSPAVCQHCGPVLLHPDVVALLDVRDGHPWCWGCPWCFVTMPGGHRLPRPAP